ncbi:four-helix bundle copper-binding protein [Bordetella genomosp. 13]|uniref:Ferredoxin n=1 Tax=Bordetella genomosp. 13 TaxID=463040 RepID=A0A1W6ZA14_9BORD|nr:four-helix bundle copper-binding protein [Bordetella genomosp. 13]ARP94159.1 ferredoxin [Bordetella genomosp. 13]
MEEISTEMQQCIDECLACHQSCLGMAMRHCLPTGGRHTEPGHFRLMLACAQMCHTAAQMMLIGVPHHRHVCADCASICRQCADSCDALDGMDGCAAMCRRCADACERMAS